jgi:hypothetical protein
VHGGRIARCRHQSVLNRSVHGARPSASLSTRASRTAALPSCNRTSLIAASTYRSHRVRRHPACSARVATHWRSCERRRRTPMPNPIPSPETMPAAARRKSLRSIRQRLAWGRPRGGGRIPCPRNDGGCRVVIQPRRRVSDFRRHRDRWPHEGAGGGRRPDAARISGRPAVLRDRCGGQRVRR